MHQPLSVERPEALRSLTSRCLSFGSRHRVALTGAVVVFACALACSLPLVIAAGLGTGAAASSALGPAGGLLVGFGVFAVGVGLLFVTRRARKCG